MSAATAAVDEDAEDVEALPRKKWNGKRVTILAIVLLVIIGGGVGAFFALKGHSKPAKAEKAKAEEQTPEDNVITYVDAPDIVVNINAGQGKTRFLKLGVTLEVKGTKSAARVKTALPKIVDDFQIYLRELRIEDLNGSAGMFLLKEELLRRINTELAPDRIEDVLFKELLLQ